MNYPNQFPPDRNKDKENDKFFARIKKRMPHGIDLEVNRLHQEVFSKTDCTQCANCCKTTSPVFKDRDIRLLAKHFRMRPSLFTEKYLHLDEDQDYVLNETPCPFLTDELLCSVYDVRPRACMGYPHTDEPVFRKVLDITKKNTAVCPAVFTIIERLKELF